jgi:rSAM/selenodomain-associated transferase 2
MAQPARAIASRASPNQQIQINHSSFYNLNLLLLILQSMQLSIIIPTYNEAGNIVALINYLKLHGKDSVKEIIVSDCHSTDDTVKLAHDLGAIAKVSPKRGRAEQMNYGATLATGEVLYFVHADCLPPESFVQDIKESIENGYELGGFISEYNSEDLNMKLNAFFTQFDWLVNRGGDQTMFTTKNLFEEINGFDETYMIMEDYDFVKRARKTHPFNVIQKSVKISTRKYDNNSYFQVNFANFVVFSMYLIGFKPKTLLKTYKNLINHPKAEAV